MQSEPSNELSQDFLNQSNAYLLKAVLTQIQTNLNLVRAGLSGQTLVVNGANLYQLAAKYYGDASLWTTIAKANGLVDPVIKSGTVISLVIPSQTTDTDGIYEP